MGFMIEFPQFTKKHPSIAGRSYRLLTVRGGESMLRLIVWVQNMLKKNTAGSCLGFCRPVRLFSHPFCHTVYHLSPHTAAFPTHRSGRSAGWPEPDHPCQILFCGGDGPQQYLSIFQHHITFFFHHHCHMECRKRHHGFSQRTECGE